MSCQQDLLCKSNFYNSIGWATAVIFVLIFTMWISTLPVYAQDTEQERIRRQLEQFDKRLSELEQRSRPSGKDAVPASDANTVEVAELRRQLDVLAGELEKL